MLFNSDIHLGLMTEYPVSQVSVTPVPFAEGTLIFPKSPRTGFKLSAYL